MDGRRVEPDKMWVCQYCTNSPPYVTQREIDFAKHMVEQHPDKAKGNTPETMEAIEKVKVAKQAEKELKVAANEAGKE